MASARRTGRTFAEKFARQARHYLANAEKLSREPNGLDKAGEMVWGALILAVKAVAAMRHARISSYRDALRYAKGLKVDLTIVQAAKGLHGQFYEAEADRDLFAKTKGDVEVLIDDLLMREGL